MQRLTFHRDSLKLVVEQTAICSLFCQQLSLTSEGYNHPLNLLSPGQGEYAVNVMDRSPSPPWGSKFGFVRFVKFCTSNDKPTCFLQVSDFGRMDACTLPAQVSTLQGIRLPPTLLTGK